MLIGIPREIMANEGRVAAIPDTVVQLRDAGHKVLVEIGAGANVFITDDEYRSAGAEITDAKGIWQRADLVMKVKEPLFDAELNAHESDLLAPGRAIVTFLHPANHPELVTKFRDRQVSAFSMDCIPRLPQAEAMDALSCMSLIAGYKAVTVAAENLRKMLCSATMPAGSVEGCNVLIAGYGVVGRQAHSAAQGLGAKVWVSDLREDVLQRAKAAGAETIHVRPQNGETPSEATQRAIAPELPRMDVVVLGALVLGERAPILLTGDMVKTMKRGSVVVDVSVDQGGNCEAVRPNEISDYNGVKIVGILNLPGRTPVHSTELYARSTANFVVHLTSGNKLNVDDEIVRAATITHAGRILHAGSLKAVEAAAAAGATA